MAGRVGSAGGEGICEWAWGVRVMPRTWAGEVKSEEEHTASHRHCCKRGGLRQKRSTPVLKFEDAQL